MTTVGHLWHCCLGSAWFHQSWRQGKNSSQTIAAASAQRSRFHRFSLTPHIPTNTSKKKCSSVKQGVLWPPSPLSSPIYLHTFSHIRESVSKQSQGKGRILNVKKEGSDGVSNMSTVQRLGTDHQKLPSVHLWVSKPCEGKAIWSAVKGTEMRKQVTGCTQNWWGDEKKFLCWG